MGPNTEMPTVSAAVWTALNVEALKTARTGPTQAELEADKSQVTINRRNGTGIAITGLATTVG